MSIPTMKVKPWSKDQGEFVEINVEDFDPKVHTPLNADEAAAAKPLAEEDEDDPLDHDGDGKAGGSVSGYHATATKGARNKRKAKANR